MLVPFLSKAQNHIRNPMTFRQESTGFILCNNVCALLPKGHRVPYVVCNCKRDEKWSSINHSFDPLSDLPISKINHQTKTKIA